MSRWLTTLLLAAAAAACTRAAAPKADGEHLTEFQKSRLLGHYSTMDGTTGFVLDRTDRPYLARLDGTEVVLRLEEQRGPRETREYTAKDPQFWVRVDADGTVLLFDGPAQREGVEVTRDANADPLR